MTYHSQVEITLHLLWSSSSIFNMIGIVIKARTKSADCANNTIDASPGVFRQGQFLLDTASYLAPVHVIKSQELTVKLRKLGVTHGLTGRGQGLHHCVFGQGRRNSHTQAQGQQQDHQYSCGPNELPPPRGGIFSSL